MYLFYDIIHYLHDMVINTPGIAILVIIFIRLIPDKWLYTLFFKLGKALSYLGTKRLGKPWKFIEDFIIHSLGILYEGFVGGLEEDNEDKEKK